MIKDIDVTVVGSLNYDIILEQERLAQIGETIHAESVTTAAGGKGANQAVQCAKFELETYMLGAVGNDVFGQFLLDSLEKYYINHQQVKISTQPTGLGIINSFPNGELLSTITSGANYDLTIDYIKENEAIIKRSQILILQLEIPIEIVEYAIELGHAYDCIVILNGAPSKKVKIEALQKVDYFIVNEAEATFYSQIAVTSLEEAYEAIDIIHEITGRKVVITLGALGSLFFNGKQKVYFESEKVRVVETTGAGDSFIGALAYSIKHGFDIKKMGKFATKTSSITIQKIGAQESMPHLKEVIE